jgi:hypothetical protein
MSGPSDESAELLKKILDVLEDKLSRQSTELKNIFAVLESRLPDQSIPISPAPSGNNKGGRPPLDWETMLMWTAKVLLEHGAPRKAEELIEQMRTACRTAGIEVPAASTLRKTAFKWMQILRGESKQKLATHRGGSVTSFARGD